MQEPCSCPITIWKFEIELLSPIAQLMVMVVVYNSTALIMTIVNMMYTVISLLITQQTYLEAR